MRWKSWLVIFGICYIAFGGSFSCKSGGDDGGVVIRTTQP